MFLCLFICCTASLGVLTGAFKSNVLLSLLSEAGRCRGKRANVFTMICLQFSGACLLYATTQRSLSQMFPCFNLCFAAGCRSSRLCVSAEGWSFRPLRASWGMLSHSSIPPVPTTLWESCLGENNWSCRLSHTWFTVRKRTSSWTHIDKTLL